MEHRFDVVAIGITEKRRVVAGVVKALARRAVVFAARSEPRLVERSDGFLVRGLKGEMRATGERALRGLAVFGGDEQLVEPEEAGPSAAERNAERTEHGLIEALAAFEIWHDEVEVIEQTPSMKFHPSGLAVGRTARTERIGNSCPRLAEIPDNTESGMYRSGPARVTSLSFD